MKITQISYRRVFNLGNFQTETVEFVAAINDNEDPQEVLQNLATEAFSWLRKRKNQGGGR